MLDFKKEIVTALSTILPTYHELTVSGTTEVPCITYKESVNRQDKERGNNLLFNNISYTIKLYCKTVEDLTDYSKEIDDALRPLDYVRTAGGETKDGDVLYEVMEYSTYAEEHLTEV